MPAHSTQCSEDAPREDGKGIYRMPKWDMEEDIVISGFSGRFPESDNVEELKKNLFEGIDMITENDRRWKPGLFGTPKRMGKLKEIDKFDRMFFGVHGKLAEVMDPMHRLILESTYEAIFDAGYDPNCFKGKKVAVFVGCSERSVSGASIPENLLTGYEVLGSSIALLANRISYTFGFNGPSMSVDTACSSTMHAFNEAVIAMRTNRCEAAIVGAGNISLSIGPSVGFSKIGLISQEGTCKVFDNTANGYVRSEAVAAIFLQKASDARRCYATVLHCKLNNDGSKPEGISYPSSAMQRQLFQEIISELNINPGDVDYVEAHGTGTVVGDKEEGNSIGDFFCSGRETPLLVGAVKSNLGHAEAASGTCAIAKVLLSMEEGFIAPNLHYTEPNANVPTLLEGKMKVVVEKTPWKPGIAAINNFGFGGSNGCLILKANQMEKPDKKPSLIPRLVTACGRNDEAVRYIFKKIQEENFTDEGLVLLEEASKAPTLGMCYRGYAFKNSPNVDLSPIIEEAPRSRRPVWFLFSGMGSQWSGMAADMMRLKNFENSIKMSCQVLRPYGVDLMHFLTNATEQELRNVVAPFVTIAAIQIALVDLMKTLGIVPDGIIGHSLGELGCAYADGCFTAEQMLMAAYWRGQSCTMADLITGAMAAVGMTWEEAKKRCPEGVFPVCHNAEDSVTISGPAEKVRRFVKELEAEGTFARLVDTCDIAFHSTYMESASQIMKKNLTRVIPNPLPRSGRWVSSSVPESQWDQPLAQLSSADYHVNNLMSPVLFREAMSKIPTDAIIIEFAPHTLLQPIVKRNLGSESVYIGLMKKNENDNLKIFLNGIGKIYTSGLNPSVKCLYDQIPFPVPRGTPMLNSLIQWDHSVPMSILTFEKIEQLQDTVVMQTLKGSDYEYLLGHKVDGRILFPFMGYVYLAWKALARHLKEDLNDVPIIVEDFSVYRATMHDKSGSMYALKVKFVSCDGSFRISDNSDSIVATGRIRQGGEKVLKTREQVLDNELLSQTESTFDLDATDFYKDVRLRGYEYGPTFQGVCLANSSGLRGKVKWEDLWITFMDSMLQVIILCLPIRALLLPTRVKNIRIDPRKRPKEKGEEIDVEFNPYTRVCRAGPVEIHGMHCGVAPKRADTQNIPVLEESVFVPSHDYHVITKKQMNEVEEYAHVCSSLAHRILETERMREKEISEKMSRFKEVPEESIEELLRRDNKSHVLLRVLKEIEDRCSFNTAGDAEESDMDHEKGEVELERTAIVDREKNDENENNDMEIQERKSLEEICKDVLTKHSAVIEQDLLSIQILNEKALRCALDIVQDNHFHPKMKVLEVSRNAVIRKDVLKMLNMTTLGLMKYDYVVARVSENPIPEGVLEPGASVVTVNIKQDPLPAENDLVVVKDVCSGCNIKLKDVLMALVNALKPNGFLLFIERTGISPAEKVISTLLNNGKREQIESELEDAFKTVGLVTISKKKDQMTSVLYLLRKIVSKEEEEEEGNEAMVIPVSDNNGYTWVDDLREAIKENDELKLQRRIWLTAKEPECGIIGFVNCLKNEPGGKHIRCFFDCDASPSSTCIKIENGSSCFKQLVRNDLVYNVKKGEEWGMYRHRLLDSDPEPKPTKYSFVNITKPGDLSSFHWIQNRNPTVNCEPDMTYVEIYYSALNFRDVMLASGKLPPGALPEKLALQEAILGLEFVGRDPSGRRVMGIVMSKGLATHISVLKNMVIEVPNYWTMEEACTIPVVYMTSYYALFIRGQMKPKESILIHSGTGGVGQAAIAICLSMKCQVFVTVGSDEKKTFLKEVYPELDENLIFNSRDDLFELQVMNVTKGNGVDLVLNSLADDKFQASVRCLKTSGRFLEIGKYDIAMNSNLGMAAFSKNITFHACLLDMVHENSVEDFQTVNDLLMDGIKQGVVRPLNRTVFNWDQVEDAFRFMASGKHTGKVLIKIRVEENERQIIPGTIEIPSIPRTYLDNRKSYIVTGALGGFGFELLSWLVDKGARKLVLSSRSDIKNNYQRIWIQRWRNQGTEITLTNEDISTSDGTGNILRTAGAIGPVGGIFHLAMVLNDGLFENLKAEDFEKVSLPKVKGVRNLDRLSRVMCPELDYFVVFSSISCGRGNPGQSNYGYANSVMERVVEKRKEQGLPGLAIQWGGIGDVGVVYEKMGGNEVILKGTVPQRLNSCLSVMERFMEEDHAVVSSFVPLQKGAFSFDNEDDMVATLCKVLGIKDKSAVKPEMTLGELGMDSLMGVEIKQVLETDYDTVLSVPEVRQLTIKQLEEIGEKRKSSGTKSTKSETTTDATDLAEIYVPEDILVKMKDSEDSRCVFVIHSGEGHVRMLSSLAKNLKCKVYGLQFTDEVPSQTLSTIADCYVKEIQQVQPRGPYRLVGYSAGAAIAFEMALILQKTDQVKTLICLDGTPAVVADFCQKNVPKLDAESMKCRKDVIIMFLRQYVSNLPPTVETSILAAQEEDEKALFLKYVQPHLNTYCDISLAMQMGSRTLRILTAAKNYKPVEKFSGRVTLIRASKETNTMDVEYLKSEDLGLNEIVDGDVEIFSKNCERKNIAEDVSQEVSKIVNDRI